MIELTEQLLLDARNTISSNNALSVPIAELSTLGAGVASLVPTLNTVTQTTTIAPEGLYQLANAGVGDVLKVAKNGNFWGAFKTADVKSKQFIVAQGKINSMLADLEKKYQYYRLSLYTFSLASLMEVMLSGNFKEEYIVGIRDEIRAMSETYRELFSECSMRLEKMGSVGLEDNVVKGIGTAGKGIDAFLKKHYLNAPVAIKNQKIDESFEEALSYLVEAGARKKCSFLILVLPKNDVFDSIVHISNNVIVINSYELEIQNKINQMIE
uniref:hypothetical protein n=1 Tax=Acetatifactor sp. TaxID=1872090 RepID=UPI00405674CD